MALTAIAGVAARCCQTVASVDCELTWRAYVIGHMVRCMTEVLCFDTKISAEGRIVIPAEVRAALNIKAGDRLHATVHEGEVRLVTVRSLLHGVWANNHGGDAGNAVQDVRRARQTDRARGVAKWDRVEHARIDETRSEEAIETDLMRALGLSR